jgi:hypothetical protein
MLQAHPLICGGEESQFFTLFAHPMRASVEMIQVPRKTGPLVWMSGPEFESSLRDIWNAMFRQLYRDHPDAVVHVEKTPFHALCLDEVIQLFPDACIVFLTRDARAAAASMMHASGSWGREWAPRTIRQAVGLWYSHVRAVATWRERNPDHPFLRIRYEDLVANPEVELGRVLRFVLPSQVEVNAPALLRSFDAATRTTSDPDGFSRMRGIDGWKQDMKIYDKLIAYRYARKMMRELGYDPTIFGERSKSVGSHPGEKRRTISRRRA